MTSFVSTPGIYIQEVPGGSHPIQGVGTRTAGFVGEAPDGGARLDEIVAIGNWSEFERIFVPEGSVSTALSHAVHGFFLNGGTRCYVVNVGPGGSVEGAGRGRSGLALLETVDEIAIVAAPGYTDVASYEAVISHCERLADRVAILDPEPGFPSANAFTKVAVAPSPRAVEEPGGASVEPDDGRRPRDSSHATFYVPRITIRDRQPPHDLVDVAPSGHIAGIWARVDATRGVHKAPANEVVRGAVGLEYRISKEEQGELNPAGVNVIRHFPDGGIKVWGARTLSGDPEWRYLNVRRLFNMIEESIEESTRWIVFEPNDRGLWFDIKRDITAFLRRVWSDGALMGATPEEAFYVQCDEETNPAESIEAGNVVARIGIAPVKPAEFIFFRISQYAGGADVEVEGVSRA